MHEPYAAKIKAKTSFHRKSIRPWARAEHGRGKLCAAIKKYCIYQFHFNDSMYVHCLFNFVLFRWEKNQIFRKREHYEIAKCDAFYIFTRFTCLFPTSSVHNWVDAIRTKIGTNLKWSSRKRKKIPWIGSQWFFIFRFGRNEPTNHRTIEWTN